MFNGDIKERYIEEKRNAVVLPSNYLSCQFNKCEFYEKLVNKDICNFTTYEVIDYYKTLNTTSVESLVVLNNQLSLYSQWSIQNNLVKDCQNHFLEITKENLLNCINRFAFDKKIVSRTTLLNWIEELHNPKDQFIMLCLFEGIKGKDFCEIFKMKKEDIKGNTVKLCTGRTAIISNKLISLAEESCEANEYYSVSETQTKIMPLIDLDYIVKGYPNQTENVSDFQRGRVIYNSITRNLKFLGIAEYMNANAIFESGKLSFIKEKSKDLNITPYEYLYSNNINETNKQYGCNIIRSNYWAKYKEYLE